MFDFLSILDPAITPAKCKIHMASFNGIEHPIDVYLAGNFEVWQAWQRKPNFNRPIVIALINLPASEHWLFAGAFDVNGVRNDPEDSRPHVMYDLSERSDTKDFNGRLVVHFHRDFRSSYLVGEHWNDAMTVAEVSPTRRSIGDFPGFKSVDISKAELDLLVNQKIESWRVALSNAAGVYLLSDIKSGKLYVGSAQGEGGIWQRWCQYSSSGHGGNRELRKLMEGDDPTMASLRFSVLEIADLHASMEDIYARESHWKRVLLTRSHGLNAN